MTFFDFLATQSGAEAIRLVEGVVNIVAAILTGAALRNIFQVKKMIGGIVRPGLFRRLFTRARHQAPVKADLKRDPFASLTLAQKVDMLKDNQEREWIARQIRERQTDKRLDRVDPPTRRH